MTPLIGKNILAFSPPEWEKFISDRIASRKITPRRPAKSKSLAALAAALGIDISFVIAAAQELKKETEKEDEHANQRL